MHLFPLQKKGKKWSSNYVKLRIIRQLELEFFNTIQDIQIKLKSKNDELTNLNIEEKKLAVEDKVEEKKLDMWED